MLHRHEQLHAADLSGSVLINSEGTQTCMVLCEGMRHVSGCAEPWAWVLQVPLQAVDLSHVSILYTQGDMAAITPIYDYNFQASRCKPEMLLREPESRVQEAKY